MKRLYADVNVTPLIDILLVLLIVFLAALPLTQRGIDTQLPQPVPSGVPTRADRIVVAYGADGRIAVNNQSVPLTELQSRLATIFRDRTDKTLVVMGDGRLSYGRIVEVIDAAKLAGVQQVGIVTESMRK